MATVDDVNDVTAAFLVAAVDALELTDAGAPGRAYTSSGRPALDCCGQVTAWPSFLGYAASATGPGSLDEFRVAARGRQPVITIFVQATRCAPTQRQEGERIVLPTAESLAAVSRQTAQDVWALWNHIGHEIKKGALKLICGGAVFDGATALEGQGGCVGWELSWRYEIDGGYPFAIET